MCCVIAKRMDSLIFLLVLEQGQAVQLVLGHVVEEEVPMVPKEACPIGLAEVISLEEVEEGISDQQL
jgi:hypothetical protein